ncbi:MAG: ABC transporter substrate-binding protein [Bacteroidota bacterium]
MRKVSVAVFVILFGCNPPVDKKVIERTPIVAFLDLLQDETLAEAKKGFFKALSDSGYRENNQTLKIIYRNAQGDQPTLLQACDYLLAQNPDLIATCPTLSTISAVRRTREIPIFMTVSPRPDIAKLTDTTGQPPANLFGVYETLEYIDTAVMMIKTILPGAKKIGTIYNQSEPQSVDAMNRIETVCKTLGMQLEKLPVNNSNEAQLVVQALLRKNIDAFFALPDNTVFAGMEVIVKSCDKEKVPVFTSEEGLVKRGAVAAFGADMFQWGYQSGAQAAVFLKNKSTKGLHPEPVLVRRRVFNAEKAKQFGIVFDSTYISVK